MDVVHQETTIDDFSTSLMQMDQFRSAGSILIATRVSCCLLRENWTLSVDVYDVTCMQNNSLCTQMSREAILSEIKARNINTDSSNSVDNSTSKQPRTCRSMVDDTVVGLFPIFTLLVDPRILSGVLVLANVTTLCPNGPPTYCPFLRSFSWFWLVLKLFLEGGMSMISILGSMYADGVAHRPYSPMGLGLIERKQSTCLSSGERGSRVERSSMASR